MDSVTVAGPSTTAGTTTASPDPGESSPDPGENSPAYPARTDTSPDSEESSPDPVENSPAYPARTDTSPDSEERSPDLSARIDNSPVPEPTTATRPEDMDLIPSSPADQEALTALLHTPSPLDQDASSSVGSAVAALSPRTEQSTPDNDGLKAPGTFDELTETDPPPTPPPDPNDVLAQTTPLS
jgi:hypothetical protein